MSDRAASDRAASDLAPALADAAAPVVLPRAFAALPRRGDQIPIEAGLSWVYPLVVRLGAPWRRRRAWAIARRAARTVAAFSSLSDADLDARRRGASARLRRDGLAGDPLADAIAVAAEACRRTLGLAPYRGQLAAAANLAAGHVVEMDTGEGKTIAAFLAAAVCAMAGRTVHVITANDYLAERDGASLAASLARLGLRSGIIVESTTMADRRTAYRADVTFVSGKEVAFDYLRDGLVRGGDTRDRNLSAKVARALGETTASAILQPALDVAIIDEIDSVLIDEAGTPLIISATDDGRTDAATIGAALRLAGALLPHSDYRFDGDATMPSLTREGAAVIERLAPQGAGPWAMRLRREELVGAALGALHSLRRDRDYLVAEGKVVIIDPHSGRTMADRQWGHDLHAMVEAKEGLVPSSARKSLASISFQRYFRNYQHLAGTSGTVREVAGELAAVYGLRLTRVPRRLPRRRAWSGRRVFATRRQLWSAVGEAVARRHARSQPVMVAVRSVAESIHAARELEGRGIAYRLLSAAHDREEAAIVAGAGQQGAVTVVTNMAGRGTDIKLGEGVAALGGLAVLICERHESRRVDRQLMGRAARQGDPGEVAEFLSCEDTILATLGAPLQRALTSAVGRRLFGGLAFRRVQLAKERLDARRRVDLARRDEEFAKMLAFAGGLD